MRRETAGARKRKSPGHYGVVKAWLRREARLRGAVPQCREKRRHDSVDGASRASFDAANRRILSVKAGKLAAVLRTSFTGPALQLAWHRGQIANP